MTHPELADVKRIRLEEDWSYRKTADRIGIGYRTLWSLLTAENPRPYDRTLFKIRRFLSAYRASRSEAHGNQGRRRAANVESQGAAR